MSDFDRFKFLELFASPQKTKRKRSTSRNRSKNSSERRKPTKIQRNEESENVLKTDAKLEREPTMTTPSLALKKRLSRTNLEEKYDESPDKSSIVQNISCDEENFIYRPAEKKVSMVRQFFGENYAERAANMKFEKYTPKIYDSDPSIFRFPTEEEKLKRLPVTLNSRLENLISSFKSPTGKHPKPNGCVDKFNYLMKKRKNDSLKGYHMVKYKELNEGEQKIKLISLVLTSKTHYLIKFTFLDESEEAIDDGNENLASLRVVLHGQILKQYNQFIVRIPHSIEFKKATVMHDIEHMRAF